jgi:transposase-like protein
MTNRVRRGEDFWRQAIAAHVASALSVADFCKTHELNQVTFYNWRRRLGELPPNGVATNRELVCAALPRPTRAVVKARRSRPEQFVELMVDSATDTGRRPIGPANAPQSLIEISLAGGMLVRVHGHVDPDALGSMVASIRDATCAQEGG